MTKKTINSAEIEYVATLTNVYGGEYVSLTEQEVAEYKRDPDGFAAKHFGLTRDEYQEWIECGGEAKCGAKTKAGKLCGNTLKGGSQLSAEEWKARHRSEYCSTHGGE
ncbi:hypothetical protein DC522_14525 [Microvirga sp. KLBC 81]|uniref:hypothetical protein n=1 Tax=Microvirga sp. KLBC 81 TaxID=1862707 RepID=UPI000D50AB72|nr:hypothetical protein [Microvirga sp. KLBC 81]PVE23662.1 hypothetical protein DC522_14525 [Microvirga sp. KLBC 81]